MSNEFREVARTFNLSEADMISATLKAANLHPTVQNAQSTLGLGTAVASGGIRVMVPHLEYNEALAIIKNSGPQ